ncbi:DUF695 domain-containing protein [Planococcus sp. APC 4015]|nr:DUF695 domain-containing protein [Planococcus sp. APC 4015]
MPSRWIPVFDFYLALLDGAPIAVWLDMEAVNHAPLPSHPLAMRVRIPMRKPQPNGLRSDEEFDALNDLEDELTRSLAADADAIYWGRHLIAGNVDYFFYLPPRTPAEHEERIAPHLQFDGYSFEIEFTDDPDWREYLSSYPNAFHQQTMANRDLQAEMEARGDRLSRRRKIDHIATFRSAGDAAQATVRLKSAKFTVKSVAHEKRDGGFLLMFERRDRCDGGRPDDITAEILDCIEPSGGIYDGWGTVTRG